MEEERATGQKMFKALGMDVLDSKEFKSVGEAIKYIEKTPNKYVVKVSGHSQTNKMTTYVGQMEDGSDTIAVLGHMGEGSVQVQEAISGLEVAVAGFFNGKEFIDPVNVNFEHKKVANGGMEGGQAGLGPQTGEMGTVMFHRDKGFKLYEQTIGLFVPYLKKMGYRGDFDINCILQWDPLISDGYRIRPLEMTNRFGWPTICLQLETMKINDLGELFYGIARGTVSDFKVSHSYSVCVVVGCPPLPFKSQDLADEYSEDMPVLFRSPDAMDGIYPGDVYCTEGQWRVTGDTGCPVVCAAGGDSLEEATQKAYSKVYNVVVPNKFYRTDIGESVGMSMESIKSLLSYEEVLEEVV
jgi:phosphoribosylamine--glycine ligase